MHFYIFLKKEKSNQHLGAKVIKKKRTGDKMYSRKHQNLIENDTQKQEFIKSRVKRGLTVSEIKNDFDREYGSNAPALSTVENWTAIFRAANRGQAYDPDSKFKMIAEKYLSFIEKGVQNGKSREKIKQELWKKYGKMSVSSNTIYNWFRRFKLVQETVNSTSETSNDKYLVLKSNSENQMTSNGESQIKIQTSDDECLLPAVEAKTRFRASTRGHACNSQLINKKCRELIENYVNRGKSFEEIKAKLRKRFRKMYICTRKIDKWFNQFKDAYEAQKSTNQTSNSDNPASTSNSESHGSSSSQSQVQNETPDYECLLPAVVNSSENVQNENNTNTQNNSNDQSQSKRVLLKETNVCEVRKREKKSNWYKFKWTNQDAIDRRELFPF